jgi:sugar-specific transcriptional regulator TrmB
MDLNGFDRLILSSFFSKTEKQVDHADKRISNYAIKHNQTKSYLRNNYADLLKKLRQTSSHFSQNQTVTIMIKEDEVVDLISKDLDPESRKILRLLDSPQTPLGIHEKSKIPITSLYRKINRLENDGLIVQTGTKKLQNNSKAALYAKTFESIAIRIGAQNSVILTTQNSTLENSVAYDAMVK